MTPMTLAPWAAPSPADRALSAPDRPATTALPASIPRSAVVYHRGSVAIPLGRRNGVRTQVPELQSPSGWAVEIRPLLGRARQYRADGILLDEPTSALDPRLVGEVLAVVADLATGGQTMVIVTHEIGFARRVADRMVVLAGGRIVESGTPEEVLERPRAAETRALLGADR